jgi:hypothetical protein
MFIIEVSKRFQNLLFAFRQTHGGHGLFFTMLEFELSKGISLLIRKNPRSLPVPVPLVDLSRAHTKEASHASYFERRPDRVPLELVGKHCLLERCQFGLLLLLFNFMRDSSNLA